MGLTVMVESILRSSKNQAVSEDMCSNAIPWASPDAVTLGIIRPQSLKSQMEYVTVLVQESILRHSF